jgi:hypothetical protein
VFLFPIHVRWVSAQTALSLVGPTLGVPGNDFFLQKGVGVPDELD